MRGTAILARNAFALTKITTLPSGHAIAADLYAIRFINVYPPSGTARRREMERFNSELPKLFYTPSPSMFIGGYFNCILHPTDTTGPLSTSRALSEIVRGLALADKWTQDPLRPTYTHQSPTGATRIDRLYASTYLLARKIGIEIIPAAFTDHHVVVLRITIPDYDLRRRRRRSRWKMDPMFIQDESLRAKIRQEMVKWRLRKRY
jgi:hypothetical protein